MTYKQMNGGDDDHGRLGELTSGVQARARDRQEPDGAVPLPRGVRHDLKNLLTIILGHADALLAELPTDHLARADANAVLEAAQRAAELLGGPLFPHVADKGAKAETCCCTVLVVDDEAPIRSLIRRALSNRGCKIVEASSSEAALVEAASYDGRIDIAIVDFMMPGLNGLDLALQIERTYPSMRTLYISAASDSVGIVSLLRRAPERVLLKPFTAEQLVDRVGTLVSMPH